MGATCGPTHSFGQGLRDLRLQTPILPSNTGNIAITEQAGRYCGPDARPGPGDELLDFESLRVSYDRPCRLGAAAMDSGWLSASVVHPEYQMGSQNDAAGG